MNKYLLPLAIVIAGVLVVGTYVGLNYWPIKTLSSQAAADKAITFINQNIEEGAVASLIGVVKQGNVYQISLKIGETQYESYITRDGKFLFPTGINLQTANSQEASTQETSSQETISTASAAFAQCLTSKSMKFYGSKNCSWCAKEKELFGESLQYVNYIECTGDDGQFTKACQDANITSFPTWQLPDGTKESGYKTLEQLAGISGCSL